MHDVILIVLAAILVMGVGYPIVKAFDKAKKEMEAEDREKGEN